MPISTSIFPKPQPGWPLWLVILYWVIVGAFVLGALIVTVMKSVRFLKRGTAGLLLRRGQPVMRNVMHDGALIPVPVRIGPGVHPILPYWHHIEDTSVLVRIHDPMSVLAENFANDKQYAVHIQPSWYVEDEPWPLYNAMFLADNLKEVVENAIACAVGEAIEQVQNIRERREVETLACNAVIESLWVYGVKLKKLGLVSIVRVPVQVLGDTLGNSGDGTGDSDQTIRPGAIVASVTTLGIAAAQ